MVAVGSRVRVAASACLVASGLFIAGLGGALALADPESDGGQSDDRQSRESTGGDPQGGGGVGQDLGAAGLEEVVLRVLIEVRDLDPLGIEPRIDVNRIGKRAHGFVRRERLRPYPENRRAAIGSVLRELL